MTDKVREALEAARDTLSAASRQLTDDHKIVLGGKRWGETTIAKIDAALAALDAPAEGDVWRDMDSAPKDGTEIWAYLFDSGIRRVRWCSAEESAEIEGGAPDDYEACWCEVDDWDEIWSPKWWLPLNAIPLPSRPSPPGSRP